MPNPRGEKSRAKKCQAAKLQRSLALSNLPPTPAMVWCECMKVYVCVCALACGAQSAVSVNEHTLTNELRGSGKQFEFSNTRANEAFKKLHID